MKPIVVKASSYPKSNNSVSVNVLLITADFSFPMQEEDSKGKHRVNTCLSIYHLIKTLFLSQLPLFYFL